MRRTWMAAMAAGTVLPVGAILLTTMSATAKTPGHEYCFHGTCHTVKTLDETRRLVGVTTKLKASFYDDAKKDRYNPSNQTSSGEYFRSDRPDNAASPVYPDGTKLLVWHPASQRALMIRVNNAGPYWGDRKLDLSRAAAERFGFQGSGVATVHVKVIEAPSKAEATYVRGRTYPPVKGYIGQFANIDAAAAGFPSGNTRLAANDAARGVNDRAAVTTTVSAAIAPAPTPVLKIPPMADADSQPKAKSVKMTSLELRVASNVEQEARKFLVAQRLH